MNLAARILIARAQAASRKAARRRRRRRADLERELAGYAGQDDFEAILERYPRGTTHELRSILTRQRMAAYETSFPAVGRY